MLPELGLGGGREDRRGQAGGLGQPLGQGDAADGAALSVLDQAGAGEVAAGHALDRVHLQPPADHGTSGDLGGNVEGDEVVRDDVGELLEPPGAQGGEDLALVRDRGRQDVVVGADAVRGDHEEHVLPAPWAVGSGGVDVPDLAAGAVLPPRDGGGQGVGC